MNYTLNKEKQAYHTLLRLFGAFGMLAIALVAVMFPDVAMAVIPGGAGNTQKPLDQWTAAEMAAVTAADMSKINEIALFVKILRAIFGVLGSAIVIGAFVMFGVNAEKPNPLFMWIGIVMGIMIILAAFRWVNDIVFFAFKIAFL